MAHGISETDTPPDGFRAMRALLAMLPAASRGGMVTMYRQSLDTHLTQIETGLQAGGDEQELLRAVHRIAGAAGMMQDLHLSDTARAMETALREARPADAAVLWPQLQEHARRTREALEQAAA
jgi:HPt (histidine-containing phosphotransfer) domain-containing protein